MKQPVGLSTVIWFFQFWENHGYISTRVFDFREPWLWTLSIGEAVRPCTFCPKPFRPSSLCRLGFCLCLS
jgi:hypothetical protein